MAYLRGFLFIVVVFTFVVGALRAPTNVDSILLSRLLFGLAYAFIPGVLLGLTLTKRVV